MIGRNKGVAFRGIKERLIKKLEGWNKRFLSKAGKEMLIKALAQAISTYTMSNILLSKGLSWKIGNEEFVDIWGDRWSLSLLVGHAAGTGVTKVSDLIDTTMGCWDDAVIA